MDDETLKQIDAKLNALLAVAFMGLKDSENDDSRKPEEVLAVCGVKIGDITAILGKQEGAIRKALSRAGISTKK